MKYAKQSYPKPHKSFQTLTNPHPTENTMKQFKSILTVIGFLTVVKALSTLIPTPTPTGTVTVAHEDVEIVFVQDENLVLRAER